MWLVFAFSMLGLLIGTLVGLTSESVVQTLLGLLFALMGGSVIAFLSKLSPEDRKTASQAIASLSIGCLIGIYSGIVVTQYRLLSARIDSSKPTVTSGAKADVNAAETSKKIDNNNPTVTSRAEISKETYIRSAQIDKANAIDIRYHRHLLTQEQAYEEMYSLASSPTGEEPQP